jgi:hypothetical protein
MAARSGSAMSAQPQPYHVTPDSELWTLLDQSEATSVLIEKDGNLYRLMPVDDGQTTAEDDPWARYDPEKVKQALRASAGALNGVDTEQLLTDIHEARTQDSAGRPA